MMSTKDNEMNSFRHSEKARIRLTIMSKTEYMSLSFYIHLQSNEKRDFFDLYRFAKDAHNEM